MTDRIEVSSVTDLLYQLSLDSSWYDDEASIEGWGDWWCRFDGPIDPSIIPDDIDTSAIDPEDLDDLATMAGAILHVNNDGIKSSAVYRSMASLNRDWDAVEEACYPDDDEDGDDEDADLLDDRDDTI